MDNTETGNSEQDPATASGADLGQRLSAYAQWWHRGEGSPLPNQ